MITAYITRHGKTQLNEQKRLQGHIDSPLTPGGIDNAHTIASKLQGIALDGIYSSDLGRAFITAYIVAQDLYYTQPLNIVPELREVSFGDLAGQKIAEAEAGNPGLQWITDYTPPNGESLQAMQERVLGYVFGLAEKQPDKTVLIVTHGSAINGLYAKHAGIDLGPYNGEHYDPHDFVAKLEIGDGAIISFVELPSH